MGNDINLVFEGKVKYALTVKADNVDDAISKFLNDEYDLVQATIIEEDINFESVKEHK